MAEGIAFEVGDVAAGGEAARLYELLRCLRDEVSGEAERQLELWRPWIVRDGFRASAANLAAYLALRRRACARCS